MIIKESLQVSAVVTAAFAGWDARKATTRVDREGRSSVFRRKMRPRSGLFAPQQYPGAVLASPPLPDPRFAGPLGLRSGAHREGWSSVFRRKMRPPSGMQTPQQYPEAVSCIPAAARSPLRRAPRATLRGAPRRAEQSLPKEDATPQPHAKH
jgi:hypothetical protein